MNIGFDIDGVLALDNPKFPRHPIKMFDYYKHKFANNLIEHYLDDSIYIITGRKKRYRNTTIDWFNKFNMKYTAIYFYDGKIKSPLLLSGHKADQINKNNIEIYYEDSPIIAYLLSFACKDCEIRLYTYENNQFKSIKPHITNKDTQFTQLCACGCNEIVDLSVPFKNHDMADKMWQYQKGHKQKKKNKK